MKQREIGTKLLRRQGKVKAINIDLDIDYEEDRESLPTEIEIPADIKDEDEISDYLSDVTGFCHKGFELTQ